MDKEEIGLFWEITNHINEEFCEDKLIINDIVFFKPGECDEDGEVIPDNKGNYCYKNKKVFLNLCDDVDSVEVLSHELAHAYLHQINDTSKDAADMHLDPFNEIKDKFKNDAITTRLLSNFSM